jgi:tetratricopeptide (TPR) repeat protein
MGNSLPNNPSRDDLLKYASKQKGEKALEIYQRLTSEFKQEKKWEEAADILLKCIHIYTDKNDINLTYESVLTLYKKMEKSEKSISILKILIENNKKNKNNINCAKYCVCIAEEYEKTDNTDLAIDFYIKASDYYEICNRDQYRLKYKVKAASVMSLLKHRTQEAGEIFETIANQMYTEKTKALTSDYIFKAILCKLKSDISTGKDFIEYYSIKYPHISSTIYYKFLLELSNSIESKDLDIYDCTVTKHDHMFGVNTWNVKMFKNIRDDVFYDLK